MVIYIQIMKEDTEQYSYNTKQIKLLTETDINVRGKYLKNDGMEYKTWITGEILLVVEEVRSGFDKFNVPKKMRNVSKNFKKKTVQEI